jgi:hypothetical protein
MKNIFKLGPLLLILFGAILFLHRSTIGSKNPAHLPAHLNDKPKTVGSAAHFNTATALPPLSQRLITHGFRALSNGMSISSHNSTGSTGLDSELLRLSSLRDHESSNPGAIHEATAKELAWEQIQKMTSSREDRIKFVSVLADLYIETGDSAEETIEGLARLIETYPEEEMRGLLESRFLEHDPQDHDRLVEVLHARSIDLENMSDSYKDS